MNFGLLVNYKRYWNTKNGNEDWGVEFNKPIITGKGKQEIIKDYKLSRYICYLIVQNADPSKEIVALGQTYFAIQTRKAELTEEEYKRLTEDEKRLYRRKQTRDGNKVLYKIAKEKGVKNYDRFTNAGYKGLYNGETANDIAKRKGLRYREDILDNMGSVELGANIFRITQTEALLENKKNLMKKWQLIHIIEWEKLLEIQLNNWVELCQRICQRQKNQ